MKNKVLIYLVAAISTLSLQSCVTNYVVSQPATYTKEYKSDAKIAATETKKLEDDKRQLTASFASLSAPKEATLETKTLHTTSSARATTIDGILAEAQTYLGTRYVFGGMSRSGIDCSAFVLSVFGKAANVSLPRVAAAQAMEGERIEKENLQKGDLIFFSHGGGRISHVAIVSEVTPEGEVKFIHAATSVGVSYSSLNSSYWGPKFRYAKRIINASNEPQNSSFATLK